MSRATQAISKKKIGEWGKYTVYAVDDQAVRNRALYAQEFSDYGMNIGKKGLVTVNFPFIPLNEIWIARSIKPSERHFIISGALAYAQGIEKGLSVGAAYDAALRHEQLMRKYARKKHPDIQVKSPAKIPLAVYVKNYAVIGNKNDAVRVYAINGRMVRDLYKIDYVEGGHGYVYSWIPQNEIWIESGLSPHEIPVIVLHEYLERTLMKYKKFPYVKAHEIASKIEFKFRNTFQKKEMHLLTTRFVYQLIKKSGIAI